jgi:hypothetical protein
MMARVPGTNTTPRTLISGGLGKLRSAAKPEAVQHLEGQHAAFLSDSGCSVIAAYEPAKAAPHGIWLPPDELRIFHLSIAHPDRYPTWDEIADARYELIPHDVTMAMLLPSPGEYVNTHEHCFHLWQIDDRRAVA